MKTSGIEGTRRELFRNAKPRQRTALHRKQFCDAPWTDSKILSCYIARTEAPSPPSHSIWIIACGGSWCRCQTRASIITLTFIHVKHLNQKFDAEDVSRTIILHYTNGINSFEIPPDERRRIDERVGRSHLMPIVGLQQLRVCDISCANHSSHSKNNSSNSTTPVRKMQ